jgi:hypothetical protein
MRSVDEKFAVDVAAEGRGEEGRTRGDDIAGVECRNATGDDKVFAANGAFFGRETAMAVEAFDTMRRSAA